MKNKNSNYIDGGDIFKVPTVNESQQSCGLFNPVATNKKAASELGWNKIITLILVLCVILFVIYAVIKLNTNETFKNFFPTFFTKEITQTPGEMSSQPVELRTEDSCVDYDFYWADINGKLLASAPDVIKEGTVYVAINFKGGIGNLNDEKNLKFAKCADYQVAIYLTKLSSAFWTSTTASSIPVEEVKFNDIQNLGYSKVTVQGKEYYLIPFEATDPGFGYHGEYHFKIENKPTTMPYLIREGFTILVE